MRRFYLRRDVDVSGVSGTGRVAEGVIFRDGLVAMRWTGALWPVRSTCLYDTIDDVIRVHGHDGSTVVVMVDGPGEIPA